MNETPGFDEHFTPRTWMNVTTLNRIARCLRYAYYSVGCELSKEGDAPALKFGEAIHNGLPEAMSGPEESRVLRALNGFSKVWTPGMDLYFQDPKRNTQRAHEMLANFALTHSGRNGLYELVHPRELGITPDIAIDVSDRVSEYEVPFVVDIGLDIPLVGRIDGIGRLRDTGKLCLLEYKTTSSMYNFFDRFQLSPQILLYNLGANAQLRDLEIDTCVVEAIEVHKTNCSSTAMPFVIQDHHVQECLHWAREQTLRYLHATETKSFPKEFSGCHPYAMFGSAGYTCDYMDLCQPRDWTTVVSLYVKKPDTRYEILFPKGEKLEVSHD